MDAIKWNKINEVGDQSWGHFYANRARRVVIHNGDTSNGDDVASFFAKTKFIFFIGKFLTRMTFCTLQPHGLVMMLLYILQRHQTVFLMAVIKKRQRYYE